MNYNVEPKGPTALISSVALDTLQQNKQRQTQMCGGTRKVLTALRVPAKSSLFPPNEIINSSRISVRLQKIYARQWSHDQYPGYLIVTM